MESLMGRQAGDPLKKVTTRGSGMWGFPRGDSGLQTLQICHPALSHLPPEISDRKTVDKEENGWGSRGETHSLWLAPQRNPAVRPVL